MPTVTKKMGTSRSATGLMRSSIWACGSVRDRIRPAAKAPMMVASPIHSAAAASASANAREDTTRAPRARRRPITPISRGARRNAMKHRDGQEDHALRREESDPAERHATGRGDARDDREREQAEDVVHDRGAQHHAGGGVLEPAEVGEHARGDAHAGGRQGGADEDGHETGMTEPAHEAEADREGHDDADHRDEDRLGPGLQEPREIGFEPHLEQEDQHAELGERVDDLGLVHEPEHAGADHDAREQLAEDRGLADPLHPLGRELRGEPDDDERDQQLAEFH